MKDWRFYVFLFAVSLLMSFVVTALLLWVIR